MRSTVVLRFLRPVADSSRTNVLSMLSAPSPCNKLCPTATPLLSTARTSLLPASSLTRSVHVRTAARMFSMQSSPSGNFGQDGQQQQRPMIPREFQIYVGNLNWKATNVDLRHFFEEAGEVQFAKVVMDRENPFRSRGFGFVGFSSAEQAQKAVEKYNQEEFMGRKIIVSMAKPRDDGMDSQ